MGILETRHRIVSFWDHNRY